MYEELIQRLRETSMDFGEADHVSVMLLEAADVIEEEDTNFRHLERDYKDLCRYLPKWIPVTERVPEPGLYLVRCNEVHKHLYRIAYCYNSVWYEDCNDITEFVTHWISLPEPPKEE